MTPFDQYPTCPSCGKAASGCVCKCGKHAEPHRWGCYCYKCFALGQAREEPKNE